MKTILVLIAASFLLTACGGDSDNSSGNGPGSASENDWVNWFTVAEKYHPKTNQEVVKLGGVDTVSINMGGFDSDVRVEYKDLTEPTITVRTYNVSDKPGDWGRISVFRNSSTLVFMNSSDYSCELEKQGAALTRVKGGCYVRIEIVLPIDSKVNVYNAGALVSPK